MYINRKRWSVGHTAVGKSFFKINFFIVHYISLIDLFTNHHSIFFQDNLGFENVEIAASSVG